jgi:putative spermidine/putrescine transport system substrate-binding protein
LAPAVSTLLVATSFLLLAVSLSAQPAPYTAAPPAAPQGEPAAAAAPDNPPPAPSEPAAPAPAEPLPAQGSQTEAAQPPQTPAAQAEPPSSQPAAAAPEPPPPAAPLDPKDVALTIASHGGAYMQAQDLAHFRPFSKRSGYKLSTVSFDGSLAALQAQQGAPRWDLVDLDQAVLTQACAEQLLEPVDAALLQPGPDGAPPAEDFLPGAIQPCGIASSVWSAVILFDRNMKTAPTRAEHLFDTRRYPGKRALPRMPHYNLEMALMADGVAPAEVYSQLSTKEGQDRAFAKLNAIKDQIVWWDKASQAPQLIGQKQVAMGLAFNGRAFMAIVKDRLPLRMLWDHQIYQMSYWAIPKGARFAGPAREFIAFATSTGPLSDQTRYLPYGPARASAQRLAGKHAEIDLDMRPYLPTHKPNFEGALAFDSAWWAANEAALRDRFAAWQEGRETAADAPRSQ